MNDIFGLIIVGIILCIISWGSLLLSCYNEKYNKDIPLLDNKIENIWNKFGITKWSKN